MKTCPYCGSLVAKEEQAHYYECDFCMIQINVTEEDGSRRTIPFRETADEEDIFKTTPELMTFHTYELLCLLKLIRQKRSLKYNELYKKAATDNTGSQESRGDYQFLTKKMNIVENLLLQRLGYIPDMLSDSFLTKYLDKIKNGKKTNQKMKIYTN
ncbi:hypothetical protein MF621_004211 (plasmid) [Bacillus velezensis]|uniref:TFIIB-type zinc ribbon-containing protein n=1 Tax=Bacillus velezensis TaxID=492670 RepID=A0ABC8DFB1_BACVE|nr:MULTISPECIES: hypothetical protein [Bacillus amyloliquefaciens group]AVI31032.1 hypothetical protein C3Z10_21795 [Bacillus velezensis]AWX74666.1 hypothetical protein BVDSYZ_21725 [Bacillus velezensis]KDN91174.1 hypothetical protein EF87_20340 [Bacillus amyloliquefaciens]MDK2561842.1 hypothetical protein [Bacillus amyloliquefaciens]MED2913944.1 hypothetical protein [Bacillus velezensis]